MSVSITFEPSGIQGLVAEGSYLIDAAHRIGVSLGAGCTAGKGECPACLISVKTGSHLLSAPSNAEEKQLGEVLLNDSHRLACQVKIENPGDLVVSISTRTARAASGVNIESELTKKFGDLPLTKKIATLLQLEAITMSEALDSAIEKPFSLGSKAFDTIIQKTRSAKAKATQK